MPMEGDGWTEPGMGMSNDEVIKGIIHHRLKEKSMQELNHDECFDCPYRPDGTHMCESIEPLLDDALALLKEQDELLKHEYWRGYNNGRADERGLQEGTIMQTFSPD